MLLAPKMGTETRNPLFPSCLYSAFYLQYFQLAIQGAVRLEMSSLDRMANEEGMGKAQLPMRRIKEIADSRIEIQCRDERKYLS